MIQARHHPPDACMDDPVDHLEPIPNDTILPYTMAGEVFCRLLEWIMRGNLERRSLRLHIASLHLCPQFLPYKRPSVRWCALIHGVSRQWAYRVQKEFLRDFEKYIAPRKHKTRRRQKITPRNSNNVPVVTR